MIAEYPSPSPSLSLGHPARQSRDASIREGSPDSARTLRIDPRTKYSHLKIKQKGLQNLNPPQGSPGGGHSILKRGGQVEGSRSDTLMQENIEGARGGSSLAPMPKLLQNREILERPLDPKELFGGNSGGRGGSPEFEMVGLFGSSIGSYISRVSDPRSSSELSFGEITMPETNEHRPEAKEGDERSEGEGVSGEGLSVKAEDDKKEGVSSSMKGEETPVAVPSYLAELGVGLGDSDLTIDSAFSSLDKKEEVENERESVSQKSQDAAKKLPSIFSFNSTSL